jgi:hypothetical protein
MTFDRTTVPRTNHDSASAVVHDMWYSRHFEVATAPLPFRQRFRSQSSAISATGIAAALAFAAATAVASPAATRLPVYDALASSYFATPVESRLSKSHEAIALLDEWLNDGSEYDAQAWPQLKKALDEDRLSDRKLFDV